MNRRDLLLLRPTPHARVYELPCERLYMQYLDAQRPPVASRAGQPDYPLGEPEAELDVRPPSNIFENLARELAAADVVRLVGREWLADAELSREVERLIAAFTERGGRVEHG